MHLNWLEFAGPLQSVQPFEAGRHQGQRVFFPHFSDISSMLAPNGFSISNRVFEQRFFPFPTNDANDAVMRSVNRPHPTPGFGGDPASQQIQAQVFRRIVRGLSSMTTTDGGGGSVSDADYGDITVSSSGTVWTIDAGAVTAAKLGALNGFTDADWALDDRIPFFDTSASANRDGSTANLLGLARIDPGGRLTPTSGTPVITSASTNITTIYYTPYLHDIIVLWDGTRWVPIQFVETSLALGTLTSGKNYDVFGVLSGGVLALEALVWTDDSTRATAITVQDGRYCKSGAKTRLYLGTFRTTSTTQTQLTATQCYLVNHYNQVPWAMLNCPGYTDDSSNTSYTNSSTTWVELNSGTNSRIEFLVPLGTSVQAAATFTMVSSASGVCRGGLGFDKTTADVNCATSATSQTVEGYSVGLNSLAAAGYHYFSIVGISAAGSATFFADLTRAGAAADPKATYLNGLVLC